MSSAADIPEGFVPHDRKSPVTDPWEPIWARRSEHTVQLGLQIAAAHCNGRGFLHGGLIASLADNAMGLSLAQAATGSSAVTVNLTVDYVQSAHPGQWLQIEPRIIRAGGKLGVVDALITADGETIARANATFRILT